MFKYIIQADKNVIQNNQFKQNNDLKNTLKKFIQI